MNTLINFISAGKIAQALDHLLRLSSDQNNSTETHALILLKNEYDRIEKEQIKNTLTFDEYNLRLNGIIDRILKVQDRIDRQFTDYPKFYIITPDPRHELITTLESYSLARGNRTIVSDSIAAVTADAASVIILVTPQNVELLERNILMLQLKQKAFVVLDFVHGEFSHPFSHFTTFARRSMDDHVLLQKITDFFSGVIPIYPDASKLQNGTSANTVLGYKANIPAIIHLLIGQALYKDENIYIRELLQNAFDACVRRFGVINREAAIRVFLNSEGRFIDFEDNGCGMTMADLQSSFSVIGKDFDQLTRTQEAPQNVDVIGRFGIGFISVFMVSQRIEISTTSTAGDSVHCTITDVAKPFEFHKESHVGRISSEAGTTIRVYLKHGYDLKAVPVSSAHYYRIFHDFSVYFDNELMELKSMSDRFARKDYTKFHNRIFDARLKLGFQAADRENVLYCNNGFFIGSDLKPLSISHFPFLLGYVNFKSKSIDMSIDRHSVLNTDKLIFFHQYMGEAVVQLFNEAALRIRTAIAKVDEVIQDQFEFRKKILHDDRDLFDIMIPASRFLITLYDLYHRELYDDTLKSVLRAFGSLENIEDVLLDLTIMTTNRSVLLSLRQIIERSKYIGGNRVFYTAADHYFTPKGRVLPSDVILIKLADFEWTAKVDVAVKTIEGPQQGKHFSNVRKVISKILYHRGINLLGLEEDEA